MRRFEFTGSKSDKFWEISVEGSEVTTRWGRKGTDGQTKTKEFPSDDKAAAGETKQIKGKLKKGYLEIELAEEETTTPPVSDPEPEPAAEPAAAPEPEPEPEVYVFTPPTRSGKQYTFDEARFAENICMKDDQYSKQWVDGRSRATPPIAAHMEKSQTYLQAGKLPENPLDPEQQAVMSWICQATSCVDFWVERHGLLFALDVLLRRHRFEQGHQYQNQGYQSYVAVRTAAAIEDVPEYQVHWWNRLGGWAGQASEAEYRELRAECERVRQTASPALRTLISGTMWWEHDWHVADAAACVLPSGKLHQGSLTLISVSRDPALVLPLMNRYLDENEGHWNVVQRGATVAINIGAHAIPLLARLLKSTNEDYGLQSTIQALAGLNHPDASAFLAKWIENKHCRKICREWALAQPREAIIALASHGSRGKSSLGLAVLAFLSRRYPEDLVAARAKLSADESAFIDQLIDVGHNLPEAAIDQVPSVLVDPPWRQNRKVAKPIVVKGLEVPDRTGQVMWAAGERERWRPKQIAPTSWWRQSIDKKLVRLYQIPGSCPDEDLLSIWNGYQIHDTWGGQDSLVRILARTDIEGLPGFLRYAAECPRQGTEILLKVRDVHIAPLMADAHVRLKAAGKTARIWLNRYPVEAAIGLIPTAVGKTGKERTAAESALRFVARDHAGAVRAAAVEYGVTEAVETILAVDPLFELPKKVKKLPKFWSAKAIIRPLLRDRKHALPEPAVTALAEMLSFTTLESPYPGIELVREACDPQSLTDFCWDLFQLWRASGAEGKSDWAMMCLAHFGDDEVARNLTPHIRKWPGESAHARAVKGLDILTAIGSDVALMNLHGISLKLPFKGLKKKAAAKIEQIAEERGFTPEQLADRLVPDLDLDPDGSKILDFGPRKFTVGFDEQLKPYVRDETGKRLKNLPKPGKKDDAELGKAAAKAWKGLKKDTRTLSKDQITRFERAMCMRRRWDVPTFRTFMLEHPLLIHVVRRLIWATYADGVVTATFRVTEDRSLADEHDEEWAVPEDAELGIPHVLEFESEALVNWGEILGDYEILQPFSQLDRDTYEPTEAERSSSTLTRVKGLEVPWGKVLGLDHYGWRRGEPQDGGCIWEYLKTLPGSNYEACLDLEPGLFAGAMTESEDQKLGEVILQKIGTYGTDDRGTFGELDAILFSELVRDLGYFRD